MNDFLPFGSQYYRAPTPYETEWESDLKNFKNYGFNTVKIWAQWRWNNPAEDEYYFDDLDRLMDICGQNKLKVVINIIYDVAPAWLYARYPDVMIVNSMGIPIYPTTSACRQIGGLPGPCYHHDYASQKKLDFTRAVVERYKDHPAMYIWDLWNEPELCYNARKPDVNNLVCYCDNSRKKFIDWLIKKYQTLDNLNKVWSRNYRNWDELELPRDPRTFKDMVDWRLFFVETLTEDLRQRMELTRKLDPRHMVMAHTVAGFNKVNGCDDYEIALMGDAFGGSTNNDPYACRTYASNAGGKICLASEIHANGGMTLDRGKIRSFNEYKEFILIPLSMGYKGFMYWQYRPELIGKEAPMWGMVDRAGKETRHLHYSIRINNVLQRNKDIILNGKMPKAKIGLIYSLKNHIFNWCARYETSTHDHSISGIHDVFYNLGYDADIVDIKKVCYGDISQYKLLYYPFPYYMDGATAEALKKWVDQGGILVSEAFFGSYSDDTGRHSITVPGFGFDQVFGVTEDRATCTSQFIHSYDDFDGIAGRKQNDVDIVLDESGEIVTGYFALEELKPTRAKVIGRFSGHPFNGSPAITISDYGKGKAILIGTLLGKRYHESKLTNIESFIQKLLKQFDIQPEVELVSGGKAKISLTEKDGECLAVIRNLTSDINDIQFRIPGKSYSEINDLFEGKSSKAQENSLFSVRLEPNEISLYRLK